MITRQLQPGGWHLYRPSINVKACRPEWNCQVDFVAWVREWYPEDAATMFHPVNEGDIPVQYRQDQLKAGLLPGVSDVILMRHGWRWPSAVIEMKRDWWKSKPSPQQLAFLEACAADGKFCAVANGADAAKVAFMEYKKGFECAGIGATVALQLIVGGGK
jgi:hypothetical protein